MGEPQVTIKVDDETGRWSVDSVPMILVPQHFFLNNHLAVEAALGAERLEEILRPAGYKSAYVWCEKEAAFHGLSGVEVFRHYMKRLSQRGWAQFDVLEVDEAAGTGRIRVRHSSLVDEARAKAGRKLCYMFNSWFEGSLEYVMASAGHPRTLKAREVYCRAEGRHDHCLFEVTPAEG
ncbi:4-vinyl reductase [Enterovirga rhinocerotis]|uniref:V4R domain-containing protein n=1 Tax=Enterovirga rhinocerotis TaxID=1339210 RepID=A0A4R7BRP9_9HYPH|nr:4-vinyl reductase [Enterovirga rhinocerotis]TDR87135.1 V4R domain-containing protein [Enterovirga rhinocerotis]